MPGNKYGQFFGQHIAQAGGVQHAGQVLMNIAPVSLNLGLNVQLLDP
jgi:hypothetical protein